MGHCSPCGLYDDRRRQKLADWLDSTVFGDMEKTVSYPEEKGREGYEKYIAAFRKGLAMYGKE